MAELDLAALFGSLAFIVAAAALARWLATRLGQPPVLGELLLGIALGPTLLRWASPESHAALFSPDVLPILQALGWTGLVLFMYMSGADMQWNIGEFRATFLVAMGGFFVPLGLGLALALGAPHWFFDGPPTALGSALVAIVMTVTAITILARILADANLLDHPVGTITMGAGTIDDLIAWALLGLVAGKGGVGLTGNLLGNLALVLALLAVAIAADRVLKPLMARQKRAPLPALFVALVTALFLSAFLTHAAGLHAVLGPLAVGAILSRHAPLRDYARSRLTGVTSVLLLPTFFVLLGSQADLTLLSSTEGAIAVAGVVAVASLSKLVGCYLGARVGGLTAQAAIVTGLLMNARGLVAFVIAKVGLDLGLLAPRGYAVLVVMILATTLVAPAALQWYARRLSRAATQPA